MGDREMVQPLVGDYGALGSAAEMMLAASRNMISAATAMSSGLGAGGTREREAVAEAIELGFVRALRRESLLGGDGSTVAGGSAVGLAGGVGIPGTGYGRMGATITGSGRRSQVYGAIGGAIGYAVGGPVGALLGGMLGGLFGGDSDQAQAQQAEELQRQWLNSPEGFEVEAYLYNLARGYAASGWGLSAGAAARPKPWLGLGKAMSVVVQMQPGAVQITGQGTEAGDEAARAFAGKLGRALELNSVVAPGVGMGGL